MITAKQVLIGNVAVKHKLQGAFANSAELTGGVNVGGSIMPDKYEGEYTVIPKVTAQTLPTKEKYMLDDVTVKEIPYFDTSNNSGGRTIYIGDLTEIIIQ